MDALQHILDKLLAQSYDVLLEVKDHIEANQTDFIGISVRYETAVHRFAAYRLGSEVQPGDVRATIISMVLQGRFRQTGIDGNTRIFSLQSSPPPRPPDIRAD